MVEQGKNIAARRQFVNFAFLKVHPDWRRLPLEERREHKEEALRVIRRWSCEDMRILTYSTAGFRAESDIMLWRICYSLDCLNASHTDLIKTGLGGYLETSRSFLGMTKRSQYLIGHEKDNDQALRGYIKPGGSRYLVVYPFTKIREWYRRPFEDRQRIVSEQIKAAQEFQRIRMNTIYSLGIDDNEFVIALETDFPEDLVDMGIHLREVENSLFMLNDVPRLTCLRLSPEEMLERIG
jgi:chlorite dismutase